MTIFWGEQGSSVVFHGLTAASFDRRRFDSCVEDTFIFENMGFWEIIRNLGVSTKYFEHRFPVFCFSLNTKFCLAQNACILKLLRLVILRDVSPCSQIQILKIGCDSCQLYWWAFIAKIIYWPRVWLLCCRSGLKVGRIVKWFLDPIIPCLKVVPKVFGMHICNEWTYS